MTKQNSNTSTESVETAEVEVDFLTPFGAARLVNQRLESEGLSKRIPPQMMYNYTYGKLNAGKKPLIQATRETGVDREAFQAWLEKYVAKQLAPKAEAPVEAAEAEVTESE